MLDDNFTFFKKRLTTGKQHLSFGKKARGQSQHQPKQQKSLRTMISPDSLDYFILLLVRFKN